MRFFANENIFEPIVEWLKQEGHEVISVRNSEYSGASDDAIYAKAVKDNLVIITMDKDFSRIIRFPPKACGGIIVVKIYRVSVNKTVELFVKYFSALSEERIKNNLVIIMPNSVRIHKTP